MPHYLIFDALLALVCAFAFRFGDRDSRIAALICLMATIFSHVSIRPIPDRFGSVEAAIFAIDVATLAGFVAIAVRSSRFWPLWTAGLQLTTLLAHLFRAADSLLLPRAYNVAAAFWSYPILLVIIIGAWRSHHRRMTTSGG